jgi:hypothetical protein
VDRCGENVSLWAALSRPADSTVMCRALT